MEQMCEIQHRLKKQQQICTVTAFYQLDYFTPFDRPVEWSSEVLRNVHSRNYTFFAQT